MFYVPRCHQGALSPRERCHPGSVVTQGAGNTILFRCDVNEHSCLPVICITCSATVVTSANPYQEVIFPFSRLQKSSRSENIVRVAVYSQLAQTLATHVFTAVLLGGGPASSPSPFAEQLPYDVRA